MSFIPNVVSVGTVLVLEDFPWSIMKCFSHSLLLSPGSFCCKKNRDFLMHVSAMFALFNFLPLPQISLSSIVEGLIIGCFKRGVFVLNLIGDL